MIHPIYRFKSSGWLKEGHTTWIIFRQCSCFETNSCVLFLTNPSLTLEEAEQLPNLELDSLLSRFYSPVQTKKIYEWGV